jgi:hypothetical protein
VIVCRYLAVDEVASHDRARLVRAARSWLLATMSRTVDNLG